MKLAKDHVVAIAETAVDEETEVPEQPAETPQPTEPETPETDPDA
jgi:hypothetical protein